MSRRALCSPCTPPPSLQPRLEQEIGGALWKHFAVFAAAAEQLVPAFESARDELLESDLYRRALETWSAAVSAWGAACAGAGLQPPGPCPLPTSITAVPRPTRTMRPAHLSSGSYMVRATVQLKSSGMLIDVFGPQQLDELIALRDAAGEPLFMQVPTRRSPRRLDV